MKWHCDNSMALRLGGMRKLSVCCDKSWPLSEISLSIGAFAKSWILNGVGVSQLEIEKIARKRHLWRILKTLWETSLGQAPLKRIPSNSSNSMVLKHLHFSKYEMMSSNSFDEMLQSLKESFKMLPRKTRNC